MRSLLLPSFFLYSACTRSGVGVKGFLLETHGFSKTISTISTLPKVVQNVGRERERERVVSMSSSSSELEKLTVVELRKRLKLSNLPVSGRKSELIERLSTGGVSGGSAPQPPRTQTWTRKRKLPQSSSTTSTSTSAPSSKSTRVRVQIPRVNTPRADSLPERIPHLRVLSWNVNGIRAVLRKEEGRAALSRVIETERPHVLCIQETKIQEMHSEDVAADLKKLAPGYESHFYSSTAKKGYSGTAILLDSGKRAVAVTRGIGQGEGDAEGRVMTVEFDDVYVVTCYTPNAGEGLKRLDFRVNVWDHAFSEYLKELSKKKPVCATGDFNAANEDVDFFNPEEPRMAKQACTTPEERLGFREKVLGTTMLDTFRVKHPDATGAYSYWSTRAGNRPYNRGLRIDYVLVSASLREKVHDAYILDEDTVGVSDHCPVGVTFRL